MFVFDSSCVLSGWKPSDWFARSGPDDVCQVRISGCKEIMLMTSNGFPQWNSMGFQLQWNSVGISRLK